ncbi:hypothetical protein ACFOM8_02100 [Paracoccus angustae]|uniref:Phage replisome organiser N-terminal domain-containing protein n=1 Tax=Paracoccus angustae TaxID=1671480 RepID=A0ABV7TZV0_9RHOB
MADPWLKFYPTDWRSDPALRMCSLASRGLWIEMIALMHEAVPYGHLLVAGRSPTDAQIAVLAGAPSDQIPELLGELEAAGVFSRTKDGVIYSRKMTRTAKKAAIARKNGKNGGNPVLCKSKDNQQSDNQKATDRVKPQKPEARSQIEEGEAKASLSLAVDHKPIDEVADAVMAYRATAEKLGWPIPQQLDQPRRKAISGRIRDAGGVEGWRIAIEKAASSEFLGQARPFSGFGIDWIAKPANFKKIMEGNYDDRRSSRPDHRAITRTDALRDQLDVAGRMRKTSQPNWI